MERYGGNCPACKSPADFTEYVGLNKRETIIDCSNQRCKHGTPPEVVACHTLAAEEELVKHYGGEPDHDGKLAKADTEPPTPIGFSAEGMAAAKRAFGEFGDAIDRLADQLAVAFRVPRELLFASQDPQPPVAMMDCACGQTMRVELSVDDQDQVSVDCIGCGTGHHFMKCGDGYSASIHPPQPCDHITLEFEATAVPGFDHGSAGERVEVSDTCVVRDVVIGGDVEHVPRVHISLDLVLPHDREEAMARVARIKDFLRGSHKVRLIKD